MLKTIKNANFSQKEEFLEDEEISFKTSGTQASETKDRTCETKDRTPETKDRTSESQCWTSNTLDGTSETENVTSKIDLSSRVKSLKRKSR